MAHGLPTEHFRPKTLSAYDCTCRVIRVRLVHVDKREREVPRSVLAGYCVCVVTSHVCVCLSGWSWSRRSCGLWWGARECSKNKKAQLNNTGILLLRPHSPGSPRWSWSPGWNGPPWSACKSIYMSMYLCLWHWPQCNAHFTGVCRWSWNERRSWRSWCCSKLLPSAYTDKDI